MKACAVVLWATGLVEFGLGTALLPVGAVLWVQAAILVAAGRLVWP